MFYASTETTSPNEAFHQWKLQTSSTVRIFIKPVIQRDREKRNVDVNVTLVPVYSTLLGLDGNNVFTLSGELYIYSLN